LTTKDIGETTWHTHCSLATSHLYWEIISDISHDVACTQLIRAF